MNYQINLDAIHKEQNLECAPYHLTPIKPEDYRLVYNIRSDPEVMYYLGQEPYQNESEAQQFTTSSVNSIEDRTGITWVIRDREGEGLGYISFWRLFKDHCRGEMGYAIHPAHQRKGILSKVMPAVIRYGFAELKLHSIYADVSSDNEGSIRVLTRNGFKQDGRFRESFLYQGNYIDSLYYSLLETDI